MTSLSPFSDASDNLLAASRSALIARSKTFGDFTPSSTYLRASWRSNT